MSFKEKIIKLQKRTGIITSSRFVIMCHQRSGSNMLTSMMVKHPEIDFFGQLYKDDPSFRKMISRFTTIPFQGNLFDDKIESREKFEHLQTTPEKREKRNVKLFTEHYLQQRDKYTAAKTIGIKFHGGTLYNNEIKTTFLNTDYDVILLHRKNLLAAAISWYQARTMDQWRRNKTEKVQTQSIRMEIDDLAWFIEKTKKDIGLWKTLLRETTTPYLELTYETIKSDSFSLSTVWRHLGVQDIGHIPPGTKKLIKSYDHIINLPEICEALESEEHGYISK